MNRSIPQVISLMACVASLAGCDRPSEQAQVASQPLPEAADLVLFNGGVYTVNEGREWAEAAAVRDGILVAVGSRSEVE